MLHMVLLKCGVENSFLCPTQLTTMNIGFVSRLVWCMLSIRKNIHLFWWCLLLNKSLISFAIIFLSSSHFFVYPSQLESLPLVDHGLLLTLTEIWWQTNRLRESGHFFTLDLRGVLIFGVLCMSLCEPAFFSRLMNIPVSVMSELTIVVTSFAAHLKWSKWVRSWIS